MNDAAYTLFHWGTYRPELRDGALVAPRADDDDPQPPFMIPTRSPFKTFQDRVGK